MRIATTEKPYAPSYFAACLFAIIAAIIVMFAFASPLPASAKTIADYDEEIAAQEKIVEEKDSAAKEAQDVLAEATNWYYKNIASESIADLILNGSGIAETIDKMSYMDKVYAAYYQKKEDAEAARNEAAAAKEALELLRDERIARARTLDNACSIQFPQGNNQPWSDIGYWTGTIATSGCGICAYTVVIDVLCGKDYTPADMMEIRGDWRGMDGYPDDETGVSSGKTHHDFTFDTFEVKTWNIDNSVEELKDSLNEQETAAIVCSRGQVFKNRSGEWRWSSGHFVAVLGYDEQGFHVADSAYNEEERTDVIYTDSEMSKMLSNANLVTVYSN